MLGMAGAPRVGLCCSMLQVQGKTEQCPQKVSGRDLEQANAPRRLFRRERVPDWEAKKQLQQG